VGRLGDDGFGQQDVGALEIVVCHIATAARRGYRRSRSGFGKLEIGLIQAREAFRGVHTDLGQVFVLQWSRLCPAIIVRRMRFQGWRLKVELH
jgi:hypothetical protein